MKKLIVSSDSVSKAMKKLSQAINPKSILPVLRNIYCIVGKGELQLVTSDNEITISYTLNAETTGHPFEMLIPFDYLNKLIGIVESTPIEIELAAARKARITTNGDIDELNSLDNVDEFPDLPAVPKKNMVKLDEEFVPSLAKVMHACALEKNHAIFSKACLDIQEAEVNLVATDTQILSRYKLDLETSITDQLLFTHKIAKAIEGIGAMELSWSSKQIAFKGQTLTVWATRHEEKFPNYKTIIPKYEWNLELEKPGLMLALRKACISNNETKRTIIELKKKPGIIHLEADDIDYGRKINANVAGDYTGDTASIAVHAGKFLTLVDQLDVEKVRLHIHSSEKAIMITSEDDKSYLGLIIPLKQGK